MIDITDIQELENTNPNMLIAMCKIAHIHNKKSADYAEADDPFSNFRKTALSTELPIDKVFHLFIATKLNRIINLLKQDKVPSNESLNDSIIDLATYAVLYLAWQETMI